MSLFSVAYNYKIITTEYLIITEYNYLLIFYNLATNYLDFYDFLYTFNFH